MSTYTDPFEGMERFFEQMRRTFPRGGEADLSARGGDTGDVAIRMERTDEKLVLFADLPGFEREEIDLTFDESVLSISALHEVEGERGFRRRHVSEQVTVPVDVVPEDITATYRNGVLEVHMPLAEPADDGFDIEIN